MLGRILDVYSRACPKSRLAFLATSLKLVFDYLLRIAALFFPSPQSRTSVRSFVSAKSRLALLASSEKLVLT